MSELAALGFAWLGGLTGAFVSDWASRRRMSRALRQARQEALDAATRLAMIHNESAQAVRSLTDKVQAHDLALSRSSKF